MAPPINDGSRRTQLINWSLLHSPVQLEGTTGVEQWAELKLQPLASGLIFKFCA